MKPTILLLILAFLLAVCACSVPRAEREAAAQAAITVTPVDRPAEMPPSVFTPGPGTASDEGISQIAGLICGTRAEVDCLQEICPDGPACPLVVALSDPAVFQFVDTLAACPDCNTETFQVQQGIGRCIEYRTGDLGGQWEISFWVSENCGFRYGFPSQSRIDVLVGKETLAIEGITPPAPYIQDPLFCREDSDCKCLSGSGVPFLGCGNTLYSPLHSAGDYACELCVCRNGQCVER